jgi:hypothetical protein
MSDHGTVVLAVAVATGAWWSAPQPVALVVALVGLARLTRRAPAGCDAARVIG